MFKLTLPQEVASELKALYSKKVVVLEYGTGGSTLLALESNDGNLVMGCETDSQWLSRLSTEIVSRNLSNRFFPVYQGVGKTKEWGYPSFTDEEYSDKRGQQLSIASILPWQILKKKNYLFTDGRYTIQSQIESGKNFKIINFQKLINCN